MTEHRLSKNFCVRTKENIKVVRVNIEKNKRQHINAWRREHRKSNKIEGTA